MDLFYFYTYEDAKTGFITPLILDGRLETLDDRMHENCAAIPGALLGKYTPALVRTRLYNDWRLTDRYDAPPEAVFLALKDNVLRIHLTAKDAYTLIGAALGSYRMVTFFAPGEENVSLCHDALEFELAASDYALFAVHGFEVLHGKMTYLP